jgi:hypothetical protein
MVLGGGDEIVVPTCDVSGVGKICRRGQCYV